MGAVQDVYDFLVAQGIAGGSTLWGVKRRRLMDDPEPDQSVIISEDGGSEPEIPSDQGVGDSALMDIGVLVLCRGKAWDGDSSLSKAQEIMDALHGKLNITVGATTYLRVRARTAEPIFVGYDEKGRPEHSIAFLLLAFVPVVS